MRRTNPASLTASPLLVGAVTLLVAFVAVFLAYNANSGLPFVPTYNIKAELPTGSKLVKGNDVRVGGFRVGFVERLRPGVSDAGKAVAIVDMKLDKKVEPLARGHHGPGPAALAAGDQVHRADPRPRRAQPRGRRHAGPGPDLGLAGVRGPLRRLPVRDARGPPGRHRGRGRTRWPGAACR